MSIQKKSLISTLKTAKKANFASKSEGEVKSEKQVSAVKIAAPRANVSARTVSSQKRASNRMNLRSTRALN